MSTPADGHQPPQYQPGQGQPGQYQQPYGGQGYPPQQPPKKKRSLAKLGCLGLLALIALIVVIVIIAAIAGGGGDDSSEGSDNPETSEQAADPTAPETEQGDADGGTITLEATSTAGTGNVSWGDFSSTNTEEFSGEWSKDVPPLENGELYTVTVVGDLMSEDAEVSCKIIIDGEVVDEATGSGSAGTASCSQPIF